MSNYNVTLLANEKEVMELPYTGTKTVAVPAVQSLAELKATISVPRYCIDGFNLARWHKEFFAGADVPLINENLTTQFLSKLLELELLEEAAAESVDVEKPSILDTRSPEAPFIMRVIRARADAIQFPLTDTACIFIGCLCDTPGQAVMYTIAYACSWQQFKISQELDVDHIKQYETTASVSWLLRGHVIELVTGQEITLKIPSDTHLHKMWELQKIRPANGGSDNALDRLGCLDRAELAEVLNTELATEDKGE